jgi:hypothetical protein
LLLLLLLLSAAVAVVAVAVAVAVALTALQLFVICYKSPANFALFTANILWTMGLYRLYAIYMYDIMGCKLQVTRSY